MSATRRLFLALWPDDVTRARLARLAAGVCEHPVPEANLHMTLAFLGDCDAAREDCVLEAAGGVSGRPFELELDFLGAWPRRRVQWLGTSRPPPALLELVGALNQALAGCGYAPGPQPYVPHVTLSRKARRPQSRALDGALRWRVTAFGLAESRATPGGVRYEVFRRWPLG